MLGASYYDAASEGAGNIPLYEFMALLNNAAIDTMTPHFGLCFGARYRRRDLGLIAYLFTYHDRLADSMTDFQSFFSTLQTNSHYAAYTDGDRAVVEYLAPGNDPQFKAQDAEFSMMVQVRCLQFSLGKKWFPSTVAFEHAPIASRALTQQHLPCDVDYGASANRLLFPKSFLLARNPQADPRIVALIRKALQEERAGAERAVGIVESLHDTLTEHFRMEWPVNVGAVARSLGLSPNQLGYHLRKHETTFRDELNEARMSHARALLCETDLSIRTIAIRLGYAEVSAFSRMFRTHAGMTATRFRRDHARTVVQ